MQPLAFWFSPTGLDTWLVTHLAILMGKHPLFDYSVQSAIHHNVLGGLWYGAALFVFWMGAREQRDDATCRRVLTIMAGSMAAIVLMLVAGHLMGWPPPSQSSAFSHLFPDYIMRSPDHSSFPSQSTTLYAAIAAGVYSIHKLTGWALWIGVFLLVALPRMYVGGHYFTDVIAGVVLGSAAYLLARYLLEPGIIPAAYRLMQSRRWLVILGELIVFAWILQVATEFREGVWLIGAWQMIMG
jgi:membrane-associated phospholipid phosphatase